MTKADLSRVSTNDLRLELKRRVDLEKANKSKRVKELQETIKKSQEELSRLDAKTPTSNKKQRQKVTPADLNSPPPGVPSVVDAVMPSHLKKSMKEATQAPKPVQKKSAAGEEGADIKRCPNCGATPSNWEFNPRDECVYCVCGHLIMTKDEIHGTSFRN